MKSYHNILTMNALCFLIKHFKEFFFFFYKILYKMNECTFSFAFKQLFCLFNIEIYFKEIPAKEMFCEKCMTFMQYSLQTILCYNFENGKRKRNLLEWNIFELLFAYLFSWDFIRCLNKVTILKFYENVKIFIFNIHPIKSVIINYV